MKYSLIIFLCISSIALSAQTWTQVGSDIDGGGLPYKVFGGAVSLSGDGSTVAIGAPVLGAGGGSGYVRIFENIGGTWTQQGSDIDGEAADDWCGHSVSLSNDGRTVAIGAPENDGNGSNAGHVRVYKNISGTWTQQGLDIDGEAAGDRAGHSVSLSGDGSTLAIGVPEGFPDGYVMIYKYISSTWKLMEPHIDGEGRHFGRSVSLSSDGSTVAIGAPSSEGFIPNIKTGYVRIYKNISGNWIQQGKEIVGGDTTGVLLFGRSVSLSSDGSAVAIGAPREGIESIVGLAGGGVYKNISGTWTQQGGSFSIPRFGWSVSLSGDGRAIAVGSPGADRRRGECTITKNISGTWTRVPGQEIYGEATGDQSGYAVSLSSDGSTVAIGAPYNDGGSSSAGHVRIYKNISGTMGDISNSTKESKFSVFPNPATDELNIKIESNLLGSQFRIINTLGQEVKQGELSNLNSIIDISKLPKGSYNMLIGTENYSHPFLVE